MRCELYFNSAYHLYSDRNTCNMLCNTMLRLPQNAQRWLCDRLFASLLISPVPSVKTEVDWAFVMVVGSFILRSFWSVGSYCILMQNAFYFGILRLRPWIISSTLRTWPAYVCMTAWCVHCMEQIMPQSHFSWACTYHKWCMHSIELEASSFKLYTFKPQMITIL